MSTVIQPYLMFNGHADEAIAFYRDRLGATVEMLMRFSEAPDPPPPDMLPPGSEQKVMHASLRIGEAVIMCSDGRCAGHVAFDGITLSLGVTSAAEADRYYDALCDGGEVVMPIGATFWSPRFGMVKDRFGVSWMVNLLA